VRNVRQAARIPGCGSAEEVLRRGLLRGCAQPAPPAGSQLLLQRGAQAVCAEPGPAAEVEGVVTSLELGELEGLRDGGGRTCECKVVVLLGMRNRLAWVIVGALVALFIAGTVDAVLSSEAGDSGSTETTELEVSVDGETSPRQNAADEPLPPCTARQVAVSIEVVEEVRSSGCQAGHPSGA
jgi:hypothetical protein